MNATTLTCRECGVSKQIKTKAPAGLAYTEACFAAEKRYGWSYRRGVFAPTYDPVCKSCLRAIREREANKPPEYSGYTSPCCGTDSFFVASSWMSHHPTGPCGRARLGDPGAYILLTLRCAKCRETFIKKDE